MVTSTQLTREGTKTQTPCETRNSEGDWLDITLEVEGGVRSRHRHMEEGLKDLSFSDVYQPFLVLGAPQKRETVLQSRANVLRVHRHPLAEEEPI